MVPDRQLGRINASSHVLSLATQLGGTILGGVLAESIGLRGALVIGSLGGLVGAAFIFFSPVRRLLDVPGRPVIGGLLSPLVPGEDIPLGE
jgi:hypothetical protein